MGSMIQCYRWKMLSSQIQLHHLAVGCQFTNRTHHFLTKYSKCAVLAGLHNHNQIHEHGRQFSTTAGALHAVHRTEIFMQKEKEGPNKSNVDLPQTKAEMDEMLKKYDRQTRVEEYLKRMNENFSTVYSFKYIFQIRKVLIYHIVLTPATWVLLYLNPNSYLFMAMAAVSTTFAAMMYSFVPRIVMKLSVRKTDDVIDKVNVATMSVVGGKQDRLHKISEIVPLMELPAVTSRDWYIPFCVYGEKRRRFLFLKWANWEDLAMFRRIMGDFPEKMKK